MVAKSMYVVLLRTGLSKHTRLLKVRCLNFLNYPEIKRFSLHTSSHVSVLQHTKTHPHNVCISKGASLSNLVLCGKWKLQPLHFQLGGQSAYLSTSAVYHQEEVPNSSLQAGYIPEPPQVPLLNTDVENVLEEKGSEILNAGLGGWSPVGIIQHCLDFCHVSLDIPWWLSIVICTTIVRILMFPVAVKAQQNVTKMNNHLPKMQMLQLKISEARKSGNSLDAAKYSNELMIFMKENKINPLKNMLVPLVQAPVFISFFLALRKMANLPLESMKTGGTLWFSDLTVPDPVYGLPIITCVTLFVIIELGAEGGLRSDSLHLMRYFLRAMPLIVLPFSINFPAAVLCYWSTSNLISLGQVGLLRIGPVRDFFKIPQLVHHDPASLPMKKKGFVKGLKESLKTSRDIRHMEDRRQFDEIQFRKAGTGPIKKTYPFDPTKQRPNSGVTQTVNKR
ncbi:mitochondrial inner membrane protein OXA1L-like [Tachypleus tridentatus]|uniref:mitochondrial inner membrane protein OXA1L-like n=1 Tax=Tachypleus tridentatus TaxID=6853 RepID=UPI003FD52FD2